MRLDIYPDETGDAASTARRWIYAVHGFELTGRPPQWFRRVEPGVEDADLAQALAAFGLNHEALSTAAYGQLHDELVARPQRTGLI